MKKSELRAIIREEISRLNETTMSRNGRTIYDLILPGKNWRAAVKHAERTDWSREDSYTGNITGKIEFIQRVNGVDVIHDKDAGVFIFVQAGW